MSKMCSFKQLITKTRMARGMNKLDHYLIVYNVRTMFERYGFILDTSICVVFFVSLVCN
jgi:hypothetical protein